LVAGKFKKIRINVPVQRDSYTNYEEYAFECIRIFTQIGFGFQGTLRPNE
jgi:hypothetical protein